MARRRTSPTKPESQLAELPTRLIYSLVRAAARFAARLGFSMHRFMELARLAYFEAHRARSPNNLALVAEELGLSLRHVGTLNRRLRSGFFDAEQEAQPLRDIPLVLLKQPLTRDEIGDALTAKSSGQIDRALRTLVQTGWVVARDDKYELHAGLHSHVDDSLIKRVDGLNHQLEMVQESVWERFIELEPAPGVARSWAFAARAEDVERFVDETVRNLRHGAVDLEESALAKGDYEQYGATLVITRTKKEYL